MGLFSLTAMFDITEICKKLLSEWEALIMLKMRKLNNLVTKKL